jgi:hypothetical protein
MSSGTRDRVYYGAILEAKILVNDYEKNMRNRHRGDAAAVVPRLGAECRLGR